jgi:tetratricopeptide (TPR) repeat protein
MNIKSNVFFIIISLNLFVFKVYSQVPFTGKELGSEFSRGMELFNKEKYPAAIRLFDSFVKGNDKSDLILVAEAEYYSSVAALNLYNSDAEYRMAMFILTHPESPRLNEARLSLGDYFYQIKNYRKAVTWYESVNRQELESDKLAEYFFRLGYSLYIKGDKSRALLMFSEIKDVDTEYTSPAVYYFAQIAYEQKMYQTALEGFNRLKDDETFGPIVPFYIVQIMYMQKDYEGILTVAPDLLNSAGKERSIELDRFIGDAYYNKGKYKEALPYLEKYSTGTKVSGSEEKYQLGYCYYKSGETDKAIKILLEAGTKNDLLSQNIWNILGDCYLQNGDKKRAQFAFGEASKLNLDKKIKEESLYNYAKLTYELAYSPFGEAIAAFQEYIDLYPGSDRVQEGL